LEKEKNPVSPRQRVSLHVRSRNGKIKLIPRPPYSPDLAPNDIFLFPNLKEWLRGKIFLTNVAVEVK